MNEMAVSDGETYREDSGKDKRDDKDVLLDDNTVVEVGTTYIYGVTVVIINHS